MSIPYFLGGAPAGAGILTGLALWDDRRTAKKEDPGFTPESAVYMGVDEVCPVFVRAGRLLAAQGVMGVRSGLYTFVPAVYAEQQYVQCRPAGRFRRPVRQAARFRHRRRRGLRAAHYPSGGGRP